MNRNKKIGLLMMAPYFLIQTGLLITSMIIDLYLNGFISIDTALDYVPMGEALNYLWSAGLLLWQVGWYGGFIFLVYGIYQGWKKQTRKVTP